MKTTTAITVQENGNHYVIQLEKATCATPNICGFDHKFHEKDLARLEEIGKRMGLNVKIENDMIEFFDNVVMAENKGFDFEGFWNTPPQNNFYDEFCAKINSVFPVV